MPGKKMIITKDNFYPFIKYFNEDFNILNTSYIDTLSNEFFEKYPIKLTKCKAATLFNTFLMEKFGNYKKNKLSVLYWNTLGYNNISEIYKMMEKYKNNYHVFLKDFIKTPDLYIPNINMNNKDRILELATAIYCNEICLGTALISYKLNDEILKYGKAGTNLNVKYWTFRGWTEDEATNKISEIQRLRSNRCLEYYINKGFSEDEAIKLVKNNQSKYSLLGKHSKKYWIDKGFSEDEAIKLAYEYSQTCSIWNKKFWISRGFSEDEASEKILLYNPSSPKFFKYKGDYEKYKIKLDRWSKIAKRRWKTDTYRDKMIERVKDGTIKSVSKIEITVFKQLKEWNKNIVHEPYIVIIPDDFENAINTIFYSVDGYYKDLDGIILIEYDSTIFHNSELDLIRDSNILSIDTNVLGIIRIQQSFIKNLIFKKDIFENAIQTIKNTKENRIILS